MLPSARRSPSRTSHVLISLGRLLTRATYLSFNMGAEKREREDLENSAAQLATNMKSECPHRQRPDEG